MKTSRKTYLVAGLVCTGLVWAGMAAFGQPGPQTPFPKTVFAAEADQTPSDPAAGADELLRSIEPVAPGPGVPAEVAPDSLPTFRYEANDPAPAPPDASFRRRPPAQQEAEAATLDQAPPRQQSGDGSGVWIDFPLTLSIGGEQSVLLKLLGTPDVTLRNLQQADQQLEQQINRLVELYTRAIRGEATKLFIDPSVELQYSRELGGEATEGVADPAKFREAIVGLVNKQFQVRQAMRKMEISSLEERVQRLKDLLQKREEAREKIVESRLSQLLNAAEGLGWDGATRSGTTPSPVHSFQPTPSPYRSPGLPRQR